MRQHSGWAAPHVTPIADQRVGAKKGAEPCYDSGKPRVLSMYEELDQAAAKLADTKAGWVTRRDAAEQLGNAAIRALTALRRHADEMDADVRRAVDHALAQVSAVLDGVEPPGSHLPYTLEELARYCEKPPARVVERDGDAFTIKVMLKSGRGQHVHLRKFKRTDGVELIQIYTVCGKADEKKFAWALRANMKLIQGAIALASQGDDERFVLSICLLADSVSHFAVKAAVKECAYYGDWIEQKLSGQDEF